MAIPTDLPLLLVESQVAWEVWLAQNHTEVSGVWLQIAKKGQGVQQFEIWIERVNI